MEKETVALFLEKKVKLEWETPGHTNFLKCIPQAIQGNDLIVTAIDDTTQAISIPSITSIKEDKWEKKW